MSANNVHVRIRVGPEWCACRSHGRVPGVEDGQRDPAAAGDGEALVARGEEVEGGVLKQLGYNRNLQCAQHRVD
jgi:hypothetical protein